MAQVHLLIFSTVFLWGVVLCEDESVTTTLPPEEEPLSEPKTYFINEIHKIASKVSQNLVIHDNRVVWSPYSVVNSMAALGLVSDEKLKNGFNTGWDYLTHENSHNSTLLAVGFSRNSSLVASSKTLTIQKTPEGANVGDLLQGAFLNITHFNDNETSSFNNASTSNNNNNDSWPEDTVLLTGMGVETLWHTPFHPRYARKDKFFLNTTHVVKAKFMRNIGFYKYAEFDDLVEGGATGVALPLRSESSYMIVLKPNNPDAIGEFNANLEKLGDFVSLFNVMRTRRVQLSLPRTIIDSQFPISLDKSVSTLHISSLKVSYTGLYNNFHEPAHSLRPIKFTRLRRRKDDVVFKANSPFVFYYYDAQLTGLLLQGMVLNPTDNDIHHDNYFMVPAVHPSLKLAKETSNEKCLHEYAQLRKEKDIYQDLFYRCQGEGDYGQIIGNVTTTFELEADKKKKNKKFFRNEIEHFNTTFFQVTTKVRYISYAPFDAKVIQIWAPPKSLYIFLPNERSGLSTIEEGHEMVNFNSIVCQLRPLTLRLRLPNAKVKDFKLKSVVHKEPDGHFVPLLLERERTGRKKSKARYRKLYFNRPFFYVITEEAQTAGGFVAMGRIVNNGHKYKVPKPVPTKTLNITSVEDNQKIK